jgi:hypothetical protein
MESNQIKKFLTPGLAALWSSILYSLRGVAVKGPKFLSQIATKVCTNRHRQDVFHHVSETFYICQVRDCPP